MFKWWTKRKQRRAKSRFNDGFDYAVGALLRGDQTEEELEIQADDIFDGDEFDDGMLEGLRVLRTKYVLRDQNTNQLVNQIERHKSGCRLD